MIRSRASIRCLAFTLLLLGTVLAATAPAEPSVEAGARAAGVPAWVVQTVTRPTAPLAAEATSGSGATASWARCQPGVARVRAAAGTSVGEQSSGAYANFIDHFHLHSPYLGTNETGDFLYNLYLTGTMRIQANNQYSSANVSVYGNSQYAGDNGGMLSFYQFGSEAWLYAMGGEVAPGNFPDNNIFAGPGGELKVYGVVSAPVGGYYTINVRIPVRFAFDEFPINRFPPEDDWYNWLSIGAMCYARVGASSDFSATFEFAGQNPIMPDPNDPRLPLEDWTFATGSGEITLPSPLSVACATGTGLAFPMVTDGVIGNLTALDGSTLPAAGRPATGFADGFFAFDITGLPAGGATELTLSVPSDQAVGTYWCYVVGGAWGGLTVGHDDGDGSVIVTLTDNGPGDDDAAGGVIHVTGGLSPEQPQAVWLSAFTARARGRGVDLAWRTEPVAPGSFQLTARRGDEAWNVAVATAGGGSFTARDENGALAAGGRVTYELRHEGDLVGETAVDLGLPPAHVVLTGVAPNPFNPGTKITFTVPRAQRVRVDVYDLAGRLVVALVDAEYDVGDHILPWDGCDGAGRALPSGSYVVHLRTDQRLQSRLVSLLR